MTNRPTKPEVPANMIAQANASPHPFVADDPAVIEATATFAEAEQVFAEAEATVDDLLADHASTRTNPDRDLDELADELGKIERKIDVATERFLAAARNRSRAGALLKQANKTALGSAETAEKRRRYLDETRPEMVREIELLVAELRSKTATLDEVDRWLVESVDAELARHGRVTTGTGFQPDGARIGFSSATSEFLAGVRLWPTEITFAVASAIQGAEPFSKLRGVDYRAEDVPEPVRTEIARRLDQNVVRRWLEPETVSNELAAKPKPKRTRKTEPEGAAV